MKSQVSIGLGYVGLPLVAATARGGFRVVGFDIDPAKMEALNAGRSHIDAVTSEELAGHLRANRFTATTDFGQLAECDVIVICVPTPVSRNREPDLKHVQMTSEAIAKNLRPGQLVVLESTTFPGTTEEVVKPIIERGGLKSGRDFWLGFSPEREDPGNKRFNTVTSQRLYQVMARPRRGSSRPFTARYSSGWCRSPHPLWRRQ